MNAIKHILARYSHFVWSVVEPLGSWGILAVAFIDSAAFGIPLDPVVAGYVYAHPLKIWLCVFMAAFGSALGSLIPYGIGRAGGELLLLKHVDRKRFERLRDRFENQEFFAMMVPAMLPPPTPFKLFLLAAGVFEMRPALFMLAIFAGRVIRFLILGFLVVRFGPGIVVLVTAVMARHLIWVMAGFVVLIGLFVYEFKFRRPRASRREEPEEVA
ncbi:MAG TPA: VTT domain-containing protein [Terriglobales bacterium]|nr:VTT domain-containing protein [Terriglobales bacterium]